MADTHISARTVQAYLAAGRRRHPDRDFSWAFGLTRYTTANDDWPDPRHVVQDVWRERDPDTDGLLDHVGILTAGGEHVPLTRQMVDEVWELSWLSGRVPSVLWVPEELYGLEEHAPLPQIGLHVRVSASPNHVDPIRTDDGAVQITSRLEPEDCEREMLIFLTEDRPEGWPR